MKEEALHYGKKVDKIVAYLLIFCFLICVAPMFFISGSGLWILLGTNVICFGFIYWMYENTETSIINDNLIHGSGPIKWEIAIDSVTSIRRKGKSLINHGTWSSEKMDIVYKEKSWSKTLRYCTFAQGRTNRKISINKS